MTRYIIGDTETTGLGKDKAACKIGLIEIDPETLEILGEVGSTLNPEMPISADASAIHGITDEEAAKHPTMAEFIADKLHGGLDGEIVLLGYHVAFDRPLLEPIGNIVKDWDLLPLAQQLVRDTTNHKLQTLKEHFSLEGGAAHRALGDCHTTLQLLRVLVPLSGRSLVNHCATKFQFTMTMPWGKHSGIALSDVPKSYRKWMLEKCETLDNNLRASLEMLAKTE